MPHFCFLLTRGSHFYPEAPHPSGKAPKQVNNHSFMKMKNSWGTPLGCQQSLGRFWSYFNLIKLCLFNQPRDLHPQAGICCLPLSCVFVCGRRRWRRRAVTFPAFLKGLQPKRQAGWRSGFKSDTVGMLHLAAVSACVCVCVCVCERERERGKEGDRGCMCAPTCMNTRSQCCSELQELRVGLQKEWRWWQPCE